METKDSENKLHSVLGVIRRGLNYICVAALSSVATIVVCNHISQQKIETLNDQINEMKEKSQDLLVTQRISKQMEEIAFQQKKVSDLQSERAQHETQIADMERNKAELERINAQKAERHAIISAHHADSMSLIAQKQTKLAMENLQVAEVARAQSDTLFYLSLANSLAQSSITQASKGDDLTRLLAYASWHYANTYSSSMSNGNVYKALLRTANANASLTNVAKGNIRGMEVVKVDGNSYAIAVSDYGEIIVSDSLGNTTIFENNSKYYKDIALTKSKHFAVLNSYGLIDLYDYDSGIRQGILTPAITETLPQPVVTWHHLLASPDKSKLIASADNKIVWINANDLKTIIQVPVSEKITSLGFANDTLHVFCENGKNYICSPDGKLTDGIISTKGDVTAYLYDKKMRYHILGYADGNIEYYNEDGSFVTILNGHRGAITNLAKVKELLISSSYDKTMRFWFVNDVTSVVTSAEEALTQWPLSFALNRDGKTLWIGTSNGYIEHLSYSVHTNAKKTHYSLGREFSPGEWNYFIGPTIPNIKFKDLTE